jgi:hypothetical protein
MDHREKLGIYQGEKYRLLVCDAFAALVRTDVSEEHIASIFTSD